MNEADSILPPLRTSHGPPPRHWKDPSNGWVTPVERILISMAVIMALGMIGFMGWATYNIDQTKAQIQADRQQTIENRAVVCALMQALGQPLLSVCRDSEVTAHFDPNAIAPPTRTTGMICEIGRRVGIRERDLPEVCSEVTGDG